MLIRRAHERGHADHGWLRTHHTFSFADYQDPAHQQFRALRVINDDWVAPGAGFSTHGHRDMEIITYVLEGELAHKDSMGNGSTIRPGDVQRMSAGTGILHSEFNASHEHPVKLLQIWILPGAQGTKPSYEQKAFSVAERTDQLRLVASPDGAQGSVHVFQDAALYAGIFTAGFKTRYEVPATRSAWLHVARGSVEVNGVALETGDAVALERGGALDMTALQDAEVLLFDLA